MIAWRMLSISRPVDRSITVSEPKWTAVCSFSSSPSMLLVTAELPMLALIFVRAAMPMHIGSSRLPRCTLLAGITIRPRATSSRINSGSSSSRLATYSISGVTTPARGLFDLSHRLVYPPCDRERPEKSGAQACRRKVTCPSYPPLPRSQTGGKCPPDQSVLRYSSTASFWSSSSSSTNGWPAALLPNADVSKYNRRSRFVFSSGNFSSSAHLQADGRRS